MDEIRKAAQEIVRISADLIYKDAHQFGTRPCKTCSVITELLGMDFGCVRKQKELK